MTVIQNFAPTADLQGLIAFLGIMATLLVAVASATYRDRQKERQKKRALATKVAVAENGKTGRAVADVKRRRAALQSTGKSRISSACLPSWWREAEGSLGIAFYDAVVATDLTPALVAGLSV